MNLFSVNMEKCVKCGVCIKACPAGIVQWGDLGYPEVEEKSAGRCIGCGPVSYTHLTLPTNREV